MKFLPSSRLLGLCAAVAALFASALVAAPSFPPLDHFQPAGLGPREPELQVPFPAAAMARGLVRGSARVAVLVGADAKPVDWFVTACSDATFGKALLDDLQHRTYRAATFRGVPVPARVEIAYQFERSAAVTPMEEMANSTRHDALTPQPEKVLDHPLEFVAASLPLLPADASDLAKGGEHVTVYVSFFVDAQGHPRAPQVESAASPALVAPAIGTVYKWLFKAPTHDGHPAVVLTGRPVRFLTADEAAAMKH